MNISPEVEQLIREKVNTGRFSSADAVLREALHLLDQLDRFIDVKREELRDQIAEGLDSLRHGEAVDGEDTFQRIDAQLEAIERTKSR